MITDHIFEPNDLNVKRCGRLRDSGYGLCWTPEDEHEPRPSLPSDPEPIDHRKAAEAILDRLGREQDAHWSLALATRALAHATLARD